MEDQQNSSSGGSRTSENCRHGHQWSNTLFNNLNKALSRMSKSKLCPGKKLPYHMVFEDWSLDCVRFSLKDRPDLGSHILLVKMTLKIKRYAKNIERMRLLLFEETISLCHTQYTIATFIVLMLQ